MIANPQRVAMPKLNNVPANTYSVLAVSESLKRRRDFAAIINPTASYCPIKTNTNVRIRSKFPISAPAFFMFSQEVVSPILYRSNISLMKILVGFRQYNKLNANKGIGNVSKNQCFE